MGVRKDDDFCVDGAGRLNDLGKFAHQCQTIRHSYDNQLGVAYGLGNSAGAGRVDLDRWVWVKCDDLGRKTADMRQNSRPTCAASKQSEAGHWAGLGHTGGKIGHCRFWLVLSLNYTEVLL